MASSDRPQSLEDLPKTESGTVRKEDVMDWMEQLDRSITAGELRETIIPKPPDYEGKTYGSEISNIRFTGTPEFITKMAALFQFMLDFESDRTRLDVHLKEIEDDGEFTGNYALYLAVAERG